MGDDTRDVVVVSDTSVLIDLERGRLLEAAFRLPLAFAVPDLLYERELKPNDGGRLLEPGLRVSELDGDGVAAALTSGTGCQHCRCQTASPSLLLPKPIGRC